MVNIRFINLMLNNTGLNTWEPWLLQQWHGLMHQLEPPQRHLTKTQWFSLHWKFRYIEDCCPVHSTYGLRKQVQIYFAWKKRGIPSVKINKRPELIGQGVFGSPSPIACPRAVRAAPVHIPEGNEVEEIPAHFLPLEAGWKGTLAFLYCPFGQGDNSDQRERGDSAAGSWGAICNSSYQEQGMQVQEQSTLGQKNLLAC